MFFSISKQPDPRFTIHHSERDRYLNLDSAWNFCEIYDKRMYYKGYCDSHKLEDIIIDFVDDTEPKYTGNFCIIRVGEHDITVTHDRNRSFPVYIFNDGMVTNLPYYKRHATFESPDYENIWSDCYVAIGKDRIQRNYFDNLFADMEISEPASINDLRNLLLEKINSLKNINLPVETFLTGGIDSTLLYSLLTYAFGENSEKIKIVTNELQEYSRFMLLNYHVLKAKPEFWGFTWFRVSRESSIQAVGGNGDEYFFRGPNTASLWAAWNDINILELLQPSDYHYYYFNREKNRKVFLQDWDNRQAIRDKFPDYDSLYKQILNILINDHQNWHLENSLAWTPFKDIRFAKLVLSMSKEDILKQVLNAEISKKLIQQLNPKMIDYLDDYKNHEKSKKLLNYPNYSKLLY